VKKIDGICPHLLEVGRSFEQSAIIQVDLATGVIMTAAMSTVRLRLPNGISGIFVAIEKSWPLNTGDGNLQGKRPIRQPLATNGLQPKGH
jgi:hypothetical protein